jgi:hypothetical protein
MRRVSRRNVLELLGGLATTPAWGIVRAQEDTNRSSSLFAAVLLGENEVPPVETDAAGLAAFDLDQDAGELDYRVYVANLEGVTESHIHKGPPDFNGNAVCYLLEPRDDPVSVTGLLAAGTVREPDLFGVLGREGFGSFVENLRTGNLYVNVHTEQHPTGEIRGQIQSVGRSS